MATVDHKLLTREILLGFWEVHILHHATEHPIRFVRCSGPSADPDPPCWSRAAASRAQPAARSLFASGMGTLNGWM